ncbi:alpha/beta hydrolase family protein [Alistipes sp.]|uniref:alpha/beta hydrolase n=1 Tax=Alistipes sp. TaxID=1872444 RepID=UPI0025C50F34|nr:alpha/beta hydrolase family protein [Alistipes sp.]
MKKPLITTLFALAAVLTSGAQSRTETYTFASAILGAEKSCTVYLPDGYDNTPESYPVLYLLHGASGCHTDWTRKGDLRRIADEAIAAGMARPMIVVMPDASGEGPDLTDKHMGYFDIPGWAYERFFFEEFLPAVEKHYRIVSDKAHRAIAGLSMGGGGTAVYALRHPELFGSACSMSGLLDTFPGSRSNDNTFRQSVAENSPVELLRRMSDQQLDGVRSVRWWVDCGDDDFLWKCNVAFYTLLRERNIPLQYRMRDGGHTWRYWQTVLPDALTFVSTGFGK